MMYLSISRNWLFSRTAQRIYLVCAILDLAFLGTRIGIAAAMNATGIFALPPMTRTVMGFLFVPEVIGTAVLTVGMTYCWLGFKGSYSKKLFWFIFISFFLFTMPVYYFFFYRRMASRENVELRSTGQAGAVVLT